MRISRIGTFRTRTLALAGIAALTLGGLAACGDGDEGVPDTGATITIGIANEQPYGYIGDDGEVTGFAPDIAQEVLSQLGYENVSVDVVEFGQLIGGLQAGQFDLVAAGMYITPDRMEQILFTDPDYCTWESLAVAEGNPYDIVDYTTFLDAQELTIAVASGTVEVGYVADAGIPDDQVRVFPGIDPMYDALEAGEVDAVTGTAATVDGHVGGRAGIEAVEPFLPIDEAGEDVLPCGAYGFRRDNEEFRDLFNDKLNELRQDGTTTEIITSYPGFDAEDVELANSLTLADFE
jgi:polar amino acid transport system substrate-binding protein